MAKNVLFNLWFNYKIIGDSNNKYEEKINYIIVKINYN